MDLLIARAIFPDIGEEQNDGTNKAHSLFNEMIQNGNRVAEIRKAEYDFLELALQEFTTRVKAQELQPFSWMSAITNSHIEATTIGNIEQMQSARPGHMISTSTPFVEMVGPVNDPTATSLSNSQSFTVPDFFDNIGISSNAFLSIVDQIGETTFQPASIFDQSY